MQLAHRTVRPANPSVASRQLATALPVDQRGRLFYFRSRSAASRDVEHGLELAKRYCDSAEKQNRMLEILQFKLDILWSMLDAMTMAYALQRPPYHTVTDKAAPAHNPTGISMQKLHRRLSSRLSPAMGSRSGQPCHPLSGRHG